MLCLVWFPYINENDLILGYLLGLLATNLHGGNNKKQSFLLPQLQEGADWVEESGMDGCVYTQAGVLEARGVRPPGAGVAGGWEPWTQSSASQPLHLTFETVFQ